VCEQVEQVGGGGGDDRRQIDALRTWGTLATVQVCLNPPMLALCCFLSEVLCINAVLHCCGLVFCPHTSITQVGISDFMVRYHAVQLLSEASQVRAGAPPPPIFQGPNVSDCCMESMQQSLLQPCAGSLSLFLCVALFACCSYLLCCGQARLCATPFYWNWSRVLNDIHAYHALLTSLCHSAGRTTLTHPPVSCTHLLTHGQAHLADSLATDPSAHLAARTPQLLAARQACGPSPGPGRAHGSGAGV
jgi:hypothetical protein